MFTSVPGRGGLTRSGHLIVAAIIATVLLAARSLLAIWEEKVEI